MPHRRHHQALPHPLTHRGGAGRHVRRTGQRRGGLVGVAYLRHGEGRRLPRRPARRRDHVPRGDRRGHRARALRPAVQPHARGQDRPAPLRWPHPQPRRGARAAGLLLGRPHRPHDPADALPAVRGARRQLLQRVPGARHRVRGRRRRPACRRRLSPTSWPPATCTSSRPRRCCSPRVASGRCSRSPRTPTRSPATVPGCSTGGASRWRTWRSSSSIRRASTRWGSCSRRRPAARAASCATPTASGSWSATPRR